MLQNKSLILSIIINSAKEKGETVGMYAREGIISKQIKHKTVYLTTQILFKQQQVNISKQFLIPKHIGAILSLFSTMLTQFKFFYQFFVTMQTVDKLYTNSTNRFPILPEPILNFPLRSPIQHRSFTPTPNSHLQALFTIRLTLEHNINEARQQQQMMQQLFDSLAKAEKGEAKFQKKMKRRCNKDILDRFYCTMDNCKRCYSSQTSLQRHVKIKHGSGRKVPPQLFRDLPPEPNLTESESEKESHCCLEMKGGETTNTRELT